MRSARNVIMGLGILATSNLALAGGVNGYFLGVGGGQYDWSVKQAGLTAINANAEFVSDSLGGKVLAGMNYAVFPGLDLGLEASYHLVPETTSNANTLDFSSTNIAGYVGWSVPVMSVYLKAGQAHWNMSASYDGSSTTLSGSDMLFGLGLRMRVLGEWFQIESETYEIDNTNMKSTTLSYLYTF